MRLYIIAAIIALAVTLQQTHSARLPKPEDTKHGRDLESPIGKTHVEEIDQHSAKLGDGHKGPKRASKAEVDDEGGEQEGAKGRIKDDGSAGDEDEEKKIGEHDDEAAKAIKAVGKGVRHKQSQGQKAQKEDDGSASDEGGLKVSPNLDGGIGSVESVQPKGASKNAAESVAADEEEESGEDDDGVAKARKVGGKGVKEDDAKNAGMHKQSQRQEAQKEDDGSAGDESGLKLSSNGGGGIGPEESVQPKVAGKNAAENAGRHKQSQGQEAQKEDDGSAGDKSGLKLSSNGDGGIGLEEIVQPKLAGKNATGPVAADEEEESGKDDDIKGVEEVDAKHAARHKHSQKQEAQKEDDGSASGEGGLEVSPVVEGVIVAKEGVQAKIAEDEEEEDYDSQEIKEDDAEEETSSADHDEVTKVRVAAGKEVRVESQGGTLLKLTKILTVGGLEGNKEDDQ